MLEFPTLESTWEARGWSCDARGRLERLWTLEDLVMLRGLHYSYVKELLHYSYVKGLTLLLNVSDGKFVV